MERCGYMVLALRITSMVDGMHNSTDGIEASAYLYMVHSIIHFLWPEQVDTDGFSTTRCLSNTIFTMVWSMDHKTMTSP